MAVAELEILIEGIDAHGDWTGNATLSVPIESVRDVRGGYVEPQSQKISNDAENDIALSLSTFSVIQDLSAGAFQKFVEPNSNRYWEPVFLDGATTPLAWCLDPNRPIMPGCGHVDESGSYAFAQIMRWGSKSSNKLYALDIKNNKVRQFASGAWSNISTPTGVASVTELFASPSSTRLYLGNTGGVAWYYNGSSWTSDTITAQHFCSNGKAIFYSDGRTVKWMTRENRWQVNVGLPNTNINALEVLPNSNTILVAKPEGIFEIRNLAKFARRIFASPSLRGYNCLFLTPHGDSIWFAADGSLWEYDGNTMIERTFSEFEGSGESATLYGDILNGFSDGRTLWFIYQVYRSSTTYYETYIVAYSNRGVGFHPIFVSSSTSNPLYGDDSDTPARGIWFDRDVVKYSLGNDKSGRLLTNGRVPLADSANSIPYTWNVAIRTGYYDAYRDYVPKYWKGLRVTTRDLGTSDTFSVSFKYSKWEDEGSYTAFPDSLPGTQDNALVEPTAENDVSGFTTTKTDLQITLNNSGTTAQKCNAAWVQSVHWLGAVVYDKMYSLSFAALIDTQEKVERVDGSEFLAGNIIWDALNGALSQANPVRITMPDGFSFVGTLREAGGGDVLIELDMDTQTPRLRKMMILAQEWK